MPPIASRLDPPRGRSGDAIRIIGSGFSNNAGANTVTIGGLTATVLSISESEVVVVAPPGLLTDFQVVVELTNNDEPFASSTRITSIAWLVLRSTSALETEEIKAQQPSPQENLAIANPFRPEAKEWERIAALLIGLWQEILPGETGAELVGLDRDPLPALGGSSDRIDAYLETADARLAHALEPASAVVPRTVGTPAEGPGGYPRAETRLAALVFAAGDLEVGDAVKVTAWGLIGDEPIDGHTLALLAKFEGTTIASYQASFPGQFGWRLEALVLVTGLATQKAIGALEIGQRRINQKSNASLADDLVLSEPAASISSSILLELTGQDVAGPTGAGGVVEKIVRVLGFVVEVTPASARGVDARFPSDAIGALDLVSVEVPNPTVVLSDSVEVADETFLLIDPIVSDAIAVDDDVQVEAAPFFFVSANDLVSVTDALPTAGIIRAEVLGDVVALTDVVTPEQVILLEDAIAVVDLVDGAKTLSVELLDELDVVDAIVDVEVTTTSTLWSGRQSNKLFEQSGQFTSTLRTSQSVGMVDNRVTGISTTNTPNTPWCGFQTDKLYTQSGRFTSTLKTSQAVGSIDTIPEDVSTDENGDAPWCGSQADKLYLQSGQYTSTLKTSQAISDFGGRSNVRGISFDGVNTPACTDSDDNLLLVSGRFTSTLKDSAAIGGVDSSPQGISHNRIHPDTPWCGNAGDKLYLQSGQFTSTLKTSQDVNSVDNFPTSIELASELGRGISSMIDVGPLNDAVVVTDLVEIERSVEPADAIAVLDCLVQVALETANLVELYLTDCVEVLDDVDVPNPETEFLIAAQNAGGDSALYLLSGQFSTTVRASLNVSSVTAAPFGISAELGSKDTLWCDFDAGAGDRLVKTSGRFSLTVKDSLAVGGLDTFPQAITTDVEGDTIWTGLADKHYRHSGRFSSTIRDSLAVGARNPRGIDFDGSDTLWTADASPPNQLVLTSGKFTSTIKASQTVTLDGGGLGGISFDGVNTPVCYRSDAVRLFSGKFSSTIKTSIQLTGVAEDLEGIQHLPIRLRIGTSYANDELEVLDALVVELLGAPGFLDAQLHDAAAVTDSVLEAVLL